MPIMQTVFQGRKVDHDERREGILEILADKYCRTILTVTMDKPKSAIEISSETRIPISTVYRRLQFLYDNKILGISGSISDDGKKFFLYKSKIKAISTVFNGSFVEVEIVPNNTIGGWKILLADMLDEPISKYTNQRMVTIDTGLTVQDAAKAMVNANVDSILVFTNYNVIGIVTIKDMLAEIIAKGKDPSKVEIGELVQRKIIKIKKDAKVKEAIELMKKNDIRRLVVWDDSRPIGMISQKMIVGNMGQYAVPLPELEIPGMIRCPYCLSVFDSKNSLSKHIDNIHIGKGLLEGNLAQAQKIGSV